MGYLPAFEKDQKEQNLHFDTQLFVFFIQNLRDPFGIFFAFETICLLKIIHGGDKLCLHSTTTLYEKAVKREIHPTDQ